MKLTYRPEIDGLRAIAVVSVLCSYFLEQKNPKSIVTAGVFEFIKIVHLFAFFLPQSQSKSKDDFI